MTLGSPLDSTALYVIFVCVCVCVCVCVSACAHTVSIYVRRTQVGPAIGSTVQQVASFLHLLAVTPSTSSLSTTKPFLFHIQNCAIYAIHSPKYRLPELL